MSELRVTLLNEMTRDELCEEFEHFLKGAGFHFGDNEKIVIITDD